MALSANDVLALARAGYNSQQIALLSRAAEQQAAPAEETAPAPAPAPAPPPAPAPAPVPAPAPAPEPAAEQQPSAGDLMAELQKLTGAIQMQNQLNSQQPKVETVEDILATIIEP